MAMLLALMVPAVGNYGRASALKTAGNKVSGMLDLARQEALSKGAMTALVLLTDGEEKNRALTILKISPRADGTAPATGDWEQICQWEKLPEGIIVDENPAPFDESSVQVTPEFPSGKLKFRGTAVTPSKYVVFLPNGSVYRAAEPSKLRLVEGGWSGGGIAYTRKGVGGSVPSNYYDIFVLPSTGRVRTATP